MGILPELASNIEENIIETYEDKLSEKKTFQFDFEKKEFIIDTMGNVMITSTPSEMLFQIVNKILQDRRYKNIIYPESYGNELNHILEDDEPLEIVQCELQRCYEEALLYHPFIQSLSEFRIVLEQDIIYCRFVVRGIEETSMVVEEKIDYVNRSRV